MKICWKYTHLQVIQDVDEFVLFFRTDLYHLLTSGSYGVNGCRQNERPQSIN